jgi:ribosomal-protein-alanine N-acetyltransferase
MKVSIRSMRDSDLKAALDIERSVYPQPWSERIFRDELAAPNRVYLVAEVEGVMIGYGGLMMVADEAHITTVVVCPEWRSHRVGTRIMLALVDEAIEKGGAALTLEVRTSNAAAQALYRRFGMEPVGVRKRYYINEDAVIYWARNVNGGEYRRLLKEIRSTVE